jgi:hypothetical protein
MRFRSSIVKYSLTKFFGWAGYRRDCEAPIVAALLLPPSERT